MYSIQVGVHLLESSGIIVRRGGHLKGTELLGTGRRREEKVAADSQSLAVVSHKKRRTAATRGEKRAGPASE